LGRSVLRPYMLFERFNLRREGTFDWIYGAG
jgi:hypothetical protein